MLLLMFAEANAANENTNSLSLNLDPTSFDDQLLSKDPFEKADFVKSAQIRGDTRINSAYRTLKTFNNKSSGFGLSQMARVVIRGRVSRTVNYSFNLRFQSNFLGERNILRNAEDRTEFGSVRLGVGGGNSGGIGASITERVPVLGLISFGLNMSIRYYAGLLTFSGTRANLRNSNFRAAPNLIAPSQGFSTYERQFNSTGMSAQPEVVVNGISNPFRARGFQLNLQNIAGTGINTFSFVGITNVNRRVLRRQRNSTTLFNRTYKVLNVNIFGRRAKYEVGLSNQLITGSADRGGNQRINYYIHSVTLGRRTNSVGRGLSAEPFQPEYEIAFMRSVIPYANNRRRTHQSVAKGIILKHGISGSLFGVNSLLLRLNMYHVDSGYVNPHAGIHQTTPLSFMYARNATGRRLRRFRTNPRNDRILPIDGVANNRQGINFQYGYDFYNIIAHDALRVTAGHEVSRQLSRSMRSSISNPNGTNINRTDRGRKILYFSSFEADVKYLGKVKNRNFYFQTFLLSYTAKPAFHWTPDFSNQSLVRSMRVSSSCFYQITEKVVPFVSYNYRRVRGNINTTMFTINEAALSDRLFSARDRLSRSVTTGVNFHFNRDYLVSLRYGVAYAQQVGVSSSLRRTSAVSFNIVYSFRAS